MNHILLVEDDPGIVSNLTEFLKKENFDVTAVNGQAKALELLEQQAGVYDLLLLDVSLADGNGAEVLACIGCVLFILIFFGYTYRKYNQLKELADRLDSMMHYQTPISFEEYKEGELSILQSELSKMTNKLVEQAQSLQEDKRYLSNAMTDISHQLRSPLTSSQLILKFLMDTDITQERRIELLHELGQLLMHINWLIESMLKMAKMDAKTAYLKTESVSLDILLRKAAEPIMIPMELHNQTLNMHIEENIFVNVDISWTCEAVLNVLKNCISDTERVFALEGDYNLMTYMSWDR